MEPHIVHADSEVGAPAAPGSFHHEGSTAPDLSPFVRNVLKAIADFRQTVAEVDFANEDRFIEALSELRKYGVTAMEIARPTGYHITTVNHWSSRHKLPEPEARAAVIKTGLAVLDAQGFNMAGKWRSARTGAVIEG